MINLKIGDKVAIIAPCGQIGSVDKIKPAIEYLQSLGLQPQLGKHTLDVYRYMAGDDKNRAADLNQAFADSEIKAVFCARAAAGGSRILPYIDYETVARNPKPFIGFCDNVALMLALHKKSNLISYNGFVMYNDFKDGPLDALIKNDLEKLLFGKATDFKSGTTIHGGTAKGKLLCCNLSVLLRLAGTPYFPDLRDKILLIEDIHERLHKIDLMLQQLKQQPTFEKLRGLIFGQFTDCQGDEEDGTLDDCFADFLKGLNLPVVKDFCFGHQKSRHVLPFGAEVLFDADNCRLEILSY